MVTLFLDWAMLVTAFLERNSFSLSKLFMVREVLCGIAEQSTKIITRM